ncbi:5'-nucleotidase C-terminal domain-containing protein, partial [candidate division WOR-3 bacterium]|nr:5'-nucleotidase C-terminal domain-containing protein [candidate division WOR-3 bacterium]
NIRTAEGDSTPGFLKPRVILERAGVRLGIFGLVTSYNNESIEDDEFGRMNVANERDAAREEVVRLRQDGADIVIGLTHIGHRYEVRLAEDVAGIDVVIGGRSNTALYEPVETPKHHTIVTQAASRLTAVGFLDLEIDTGTRKPVGYSGRLVNLYAEEVPQDPGFAAYLDSLRREAERGFDEVVGTSRRVLGREDKRESPAGNLVTDAMREYLSADIALHNSSGIRKDIPEGEVTYRDCYEIDGFGNTLVVGEYTGRQVREMLELSVNERYWILQVSGLAMSYDPNQPFGAKVREVLVGDAPLDPDVRYRVVTNSFLGGEEGSYGVFQQGENVEDTNVPFRDAIADYFRRHSPVDARVEGRVKTVKP